MIGLEMLFSSMLICNFNRLNNHNLSLLNSMSIKRYHPVHLVNQEEINGMSMECPFCLETLPRYDLRNNHFLWDCISYPADKRLVLINTVNNGGLSQLIL